MTSKINSSQYLDKSGNKLFSPTVDVTRKEYNKAAVGRNRHLINLSMLDEIDYTGASGTDENDR